MISTTELEQPMRIASCIEDGFSFISHSDSIEQELPLDVYMGPLVYVYDAMGTLCKASSVSRGGAATCIVCD